MKKKTVIMVAIMIAFYVCWTPLAASEFGLLTFAIVITCTNGIINPIIYGVMNKKFRKAYKRIFRY